ncbi:MAG: 30S ribosomal protein S8 [Chloroflexi bacterium]|nr:MAG: 30S ribosomal protein S8 [SAR202 cluster bacterium]KAA1300229.1 MAG: 30S ribosomal protein S8 [SAR202 cluster bacterium]MAX12132.1 30S ribosomal protein S8 [Chloroflexota bacterium]MQF97772.1 30S ribosomal protein S8 [SAR202 cluster bacterium]MQG12538.1 30S ribosomal protein S8 [SAR202 cluster bacterium]
MTVQDQISDMITRIRNSVLVKHSTVAVNKSKVNNKILEVLSNEGFISEFEEDVSEKTPNYSIKLKYYDDGSSAITGLKRVSKPGLKIYVKKDEIPSYFSGMGVAIVSTSKGIMTGLEAKKLSLGGEVLFYIW